MYKKPCGGKKPIGGGDVPSKPFKWRGRKDPHPGKDPIGGD